jgi:hypothetical protein
MTSLEQPGNSIANPLNDDEGLAADNTAPTVSLPTSAAKTSRARWLVPTALGACLLAVSLYWPLQRNYLWAYRPVSWFGTANFILLAVGILIGLLLILVPIGLRRTQLFRDNPRVATTLIFPLVMWTVGMSAVTLTFMRTDSKYPDPQVKPCLELYADAVAVASKNPSFRLSSENPDEKRCGVNQAVFGAA